MQTQTPADELADVRAQIARLRAREVELAANLPMIPTETPQRPRPGWPIRRQASAVSPPVRH